MKSLIVLCAIFVVSAYGQFTFPAEIYEANDDKTGGLEQFLRATLENFRGEMKVGIPLIQLPPADPLIWKPSRVQVSNNQVELDLKLHQLNVVGLSGFEVPKLKADLSTLTLDVILRLPRVTASGSYDCNGKFIKFIPLYGNGNYQITISGTEVAVKTSLRYNGKEMVITPLVLDLKWDNLSLDLGNFLGGGDFAKQVQRMLPALGKTFFDEFKPKIMALASRGLTKLINSELQKEEVKKILNTFIPAVTGKLLF